MRAVISPFGVGHADDGDFLNGLVLEHHPFDLDRRDVLAAALDDVLDPVADLDVAVRVNDGRVAGMKPAAANGLGRRLGVVEIALHHDVAARDDLADRLAVGRNLAAVVADHAHFARGDELDALSSLDRRPLVGRQRGVCRQRLTDRDQGGRLGQPVDVGDGPAEFAFDPADGRRRGRCAGGNDLNLPARPPPDFGRARWRGR